MPNTATPTPPQSPRAGPMPEQGLNPALAAWMGVILARFSQGRLYGRVTLHFENGKLIRATEEISHKAPNS